MTEFKSPLKEEDYQAMREIAARCDARAPFIEALSSLDIDTKGLEAQNAAQKRFCQRCCEMHSQGIL